MNLNVWGLWISDLTMLRRVICSILVCAVSVLWIVEPKCVAVEKENWRQLSEGLSVGRFKVNGRSDTDPEVVIIRVDPQVYELVLLCAAGLGEKNMTVKQWCKKYGLIGGINAGMFQEDYRSNVGYMKNFNYLNNPRINPLYKSVIAFNPVAKERPYFKIFDIDESNMKDIIRDYRTVIQNLRLIKKPAENRWKKTQGKKWCEAALGEDKFGNALFIFCNKPYSMYEFNEILIGLPINIVNAQHMEGGPLASLYFSYNDVTLDFVGTCAINVADGYDDSYWAVPNVLGFKKR